jgi:hypothetical protein
MRRIGQTLAVLGLLFLVCLVCKADGDEANAIIEKAMKAHGLKSRDKDAETYAFRGKNKGTLHVLGMDIEINQEVAVKVPDKFKEVMEMTVMNKKITVTSVFNGKEAWIKAGDKEVPITDDILAEFKEAAYMMRLSQAMFLKDKSLKLSLLGEAQVNGKPAVGVKVEKEGKKDIDFYFDKGTGLIAKIQRRARDLMGGQEVTEERIITEYQELKGRKIAKKAEIKRDGKQFIEVEVVEAELPDSIDDSEFARP